MIALSLLCSLRAEIFINLKIKSSPCHRTFRPPVFSVSPHRRQPTRLPHPWDSPGKNTGVGCHFLLQCMNVKSESEVTQLCPTLSNPMDSGPPGSSVHGIFRARVLEWGAIAFSRNYTYSAPILPFLFFLDTHSRKRGMKLWPKLLNQTFLPVHLNHEGRFRD